MPVKKEWLDSYLSGCVQELDFDWSSFYLDLTCDINHHQHHFNFILALLISKTFKKKFTR